MSSEPQTAKETEGDQPRVMNYGGFGSSFGAKKVEPKPENQAHPGPTEAPKTFNYGGFGKPRDPAPKIEAQPTTSEQPQ